MPLTPEEIRSKSFSVVHGNGYDRAEVAAFLEQIAYDYRALVKAKAEMDGGVSADEDVGDEIREVLQTAFKSAARIRESAQQEAERALAEAERRANELRERGERTQAQLHGRTEKETQAMIADANQQARDMLERAEREAAALRADAQKRFQTMAAHEQLLRERIGRIDDLVEELKEEIQPLAMEDLTEQVRSNEEPSRAR